MNLGIMYLQIIQVGHRNMYITELVHQQRVHQDIETTQLYDILQYILSYKYIIMIFKLPS